MKFQFKKFESCFRCGSFAQIKINKTTKQPPPPTLDTCINKLMGFSIKRPFAFHCTPATNCFYTYRHA